MSDPRLSEPSASEPGASEPGASEPGASEPGASEPSAADLARKIVAGEHRGALATVTADGYPFGSVANYAIDEAGSPLLCMSTLAPHTQNASANPRASLLVSEPVAEGTDPLAVGRVTLVGTLVEVGPGDRDVVRDLFLLANPVAAPYLDFADFGFWRLEVHTVRWVGGYGRMGWVDATEYASAPEPR